MANSVKLIAIKVVVLAAIIVLIVYPLVQSAKLLSINPANIVQANNSRYYENFIYNYDPQIPRSCIVFTYDPSLFNINGIPAAQMTYISSPGQYANITAGYSCVLIDYGYWCYTPNNVCNSSLSQFTVNEIVSTKYEEYTYRIYRVTGFSKSSTLS